MAQRILTVDDLTGQEDAETRAIGLDGVWYEIDLTDESYASLRQDIGKYLEVARRKGSAPAQKSGKAPKKLPRTESLQLQAIRDWANANGHTVSNLGRIPAAVVEAFKEAHQPGVSLPKRPAKKAEPAVPAFSAAGA